MSVFVSQRDGRFVFVLFCFCFFLIGIILSVDLHFVLTSSVAVLGNG